MRKYVLAMLFTLTGIGSASAQFEEGTKYLGANINNLGVSYSKATDLSINLGANAGYCIKDNVLVMGLVNFDYSFNTLKRLDLGGKIRYYIADTGIFLSAGAKFVHENSDYNDFQVTPEVGFSYFLNDHLAIQPSVYYDMSFSDFNEKSRLGVSLGLGWYF